jgi:hypothetical protein
LPSPPLTDPDVRITRIRFFARKIRSGDVVLMDDQGWRQGIPRKHGFEARPWQITVTPAPREPFLPYPQELVVVPADPPAVSRDAIVGAVPPDHSRQMGVLFPERVVQVSPTPLRHGSQRACVPVFCRYLPNDVLAIPGLAPHVGEAKKVERRSHRRRVMPTWASEPEVYEAGLGRMEQKPIPAKALAQHVQHSLAGQVVLKGHHSVISIADQLAPPSESRSRHPLEPLVQHVVQVNVREQRRDHTPLGRSSSRAAQDALFEHPRLQPFVDHLPDDAVRDSLFEELSQVRVVDGVEGSGGKLPIAVISRIR